MILTGRYSLLGPENQRFYWNQSFNIFQLNPGKVGTNTLIVAKKNLSPSLAKSVPWVSPKNSDEHRTPVAAGREIKCLCGVTEQIAPNSWILRA